jgi:hypothetical protein
MSTTVAKKASRTNWPDVDRQIRQGKAVLRKLRDTLEDLDDRRELARARKRNGGKSGASWESVKREFGFNF